MFKDSVNTFAHVLFTTCVFLFHALIEKSIKSTHNGFLLKFLRSLLVYILKQFFFSISVDSGRILTSISKNNC